jgi:hypothetical protein
MTIYDCMSLKTVTNQSQTAVNGPIILDCWFEEGNCVVSAAKSHSTGGVMLDRPLYTWASQVTYADNPTAPDFVSPATQNTEYTYAKLYGKPILVLSSSITSGTTPIVGVLGNDLLGPVSIPASSGLADTPAKRIAGRYLRHGQCTLFGLAYYPVAVDATTNIDVGTHLVYDKSSALFKYQAAGTSPVIAMHSAEDVSGQYVGALFYGCPEAET